MSDYLSLEFILYLGRWILSGLVSLIPLYLLIKYEIGKGKYQEYIHLMIVQVIGAFIFYKLDKMLLS